MSTYQSLLEERLNGQTVRQREKQGVRTALRYLKFLIQDKTHNFDYESEKDVRVYQTAIDLGLVELTPISPVVQDFFFDDDDGTRFLVKPTVRGREIYAALQREGYDFDPSVRVRKLRNRTKSNVS